MGIGRGGSLWHPTRALVVSDGLLPGRSPFPEKRNPLVHSSPSKSVVSLGSQSAGRGGGKENNAGIDSGGREWQLTISLTRRFGEFPYKLPEGMLVRL